MYSMSHPELRRLSSLLLALALAAGAAACSGSSRSESSEEGAAMEAAEHAEGGEAREGREHGEEGEHARGEEGSGGEGEESGVYIASDETWDAVRRGARLVLSYDASADAFTGTVENTTDAPLCAVRVEVHLRSGAELGPTERVDVPAGGSVEIRLSDEGREVGSWTAHPEVSRCSGDSV
jgi:hypothetical protein